MVPVPFITTAIAVPYPSVESYLLALPVGPGKMNDHPHIEIVPDPDYPSVRPHRLTESEQWRKWASGKFSGGGQGSSHSVLRGIAFLFRIAGILGLVWCALIWLISWNPKLVRQVDAVWSVLVLPWVYWTSVGQYSLGAVLALLCDVESHLRKLASRR